MVGKRETVKPETELKPQDNANQEIATNRFQTLQEEAEFHEPWKERNLSHSLGTSGALFHLTKASIGTGILAMPEAFSNGGLWVSLGIALAVGVIYTHCVHIVVVCSHVLCTRVGQPQLSFTEIVEAAFRTGPVAWRKYARVARNVVDTGLFFNYYSCLSVYLLFVSSTLKQVISDDLSFEMDLRLYMVALMGVFIPLGLVRSLRFLAPCSLLALCGLSACCGVVLYDVLHGLPPLSARPAFTSFARLPLCFSTVIFAVDGMGTALPIENAMKRPEDFLGFTGILTISMIWTMALYCSMGFFGYLRFGDATQASITLNLSSSLVSQTVKILVAVNVFVSYLLYLLVPAEIICRKLYPTTRGTKKMLYDYIARLTLILGSVVLAVAVPNLELFVGLAGAIGASSTMLCFPAVIHLVTCWENGGSSRWGRLKDFLIILVWLVTLVTGTHLSLADIMEFYRHKPKDTISTDLSRV